MDRKKPNIEAARQMVAHSKGARQRELTARCLLLHPKEIPMAADADRTALDDYVQRGGWKGLWHRDKTMCRMLREAAEK